MKVLFIYPAFNRHGDDHPELLEFVPMNEYLGSPSLGIATMSAVTPAEWDVEFRDDRLVDGAAPTDADIIALSFFTPAATRALELADIFRKRGKTVIAGGIFPTAMPDLVANHVDTVVVGEGDELWPQILADFTEGTLKPRYQACGAVSLDRLPVPDVDLYIQNEGARFHPDDYPLQISRGCAMKCHACILPKSMTRNMRTYPLDHVVKSLEALQSQGKRACLTEDTSWFPGHKGRHLLEDTLDHIIASGGEAPISYIGISMPMILTTPTRLFKKARKAGVDMFYLVGGFDPITKGAFTGKNPRMLQKAKDSIAKAWDVGIEPYTSFLLGGDQDNPGTVDAMLKFADDAKIRKAEFAIATPYPGTPQWYQLNAEDRILTREWRKYNDANIVFQPKQMTPEQVQTGYITLWKEFYRNRQHLADLPLDQRTIQF